MKTPSFTDDLQTDTASVCQSPAKLQTRTSTDIINIPTQPFHKHLKHSVPQPGTPALPPNLLCPTSASLELYRLQTKPLSFFSKLRRCPLASPSLHKPSPSHLDLHLLGTQQKHHPQTNGAVPELVLESSCLLFLNYNESLASLVVHLVKNLPAMRETLGKEMATHSSILAWRIPSTEEPGRLQSMGSQRVRHD